MREKAKVLLNEMERIIENYPDMRVGEMIVKSLRKKDSLEYIDDDVLALRIHEIAENMSSRTEEEIRNKQIYDIAQGQN